MRPHIHACLTFDHRPIDGGMGVRLAARVRENLESPQGLFAS
jgi:pyruvate/2-oxoglutarate dehydrogenase complex dihydrolipoamide acyltransferase (E2) component